MMQVLIMIIGVFVIMGIQRYDARHGKHLGGFMGIAIVILTILMVLTSYKNLQPPKDSDAGKTEVTTENK